MDQHDWLAEQFEANRSHLRSVAYRMLGSLAEADDAVQESWLHLSRAGFFSKPGNTAQLAFINGAAGAFGRLRQLDLTILND